MSTSIAEGNKIIAEFMGAKTDSYNKWFYESRINDVYFLGHSPKEFRYHSSWNWLMPVVEKIQELGYSVIVNFEGKKLACFTNTTIDDSQLSPTVIVDGYSEKSGIQSVWSAVIQFIQWYTPLTPINKP